MAAPKRISPLAQFAPIFYFLNCAAFAGWSYVLYLLITFSSNNGDTTLSDGQALLAVTRTPVLFLEGICIIEVVRIFLRDLPGNLILGVILHAIRFTAILEVLPRAADSINYETMSGAPQWTWTVSAVLLSWAITEVTRYPMYMFPANNLCRSIRMVVPLATFPVGAAAEFLGAYQVFAGRNNTTHPVPFWLQFLLVLMMVVNGILGPYLAYPALLKKGLPVLGHGTKKEKPKLRSV